METIVCIGEGRGIDQAGRAAARSKAAGDRVVGIIAADPGDNSDKIMRMRESCAELFFSPSGVLTPLKELFEAIERSTHTKYPEIVYIFAPIGSVKSVSDFTAGYPVKTIGRVV